MPAPLWCADDAMVTLKLFGDFRLSDARGAALVLPARKDQALLAFLALNNGAAREQLIALLWPDRAEAQGRKSLRQSLVVLRKHLNGADQVLPADRRQVLALAPGTVAVDVQRFETLARKSDLVSLRAAAGLYEGSLLPHFSVPAPGFSDWLDGERRRFEDLACGVFDALAETLIEQEIWSEAEAAAHRAIEINPLRENGHRLLMRALAGAGNRADALQQYHHLSGTLRRELSIRPDLDSEALYQAIRRPAPATPHQGRPELIRPKNARPGLIVLPLQLGGEADDAALADGLGEEIIATLAGYRWFYVISAVQSQIYRNRRISPSELAAELGVTYVLDGRVRRSGNRISLRLNLSETGRGELIWSESMECYFDETLQAQADLARQITRQIEPELLRAEDEMGGNGASPDMDAWHLAVRARRLADQARQDSLQQAYDLATRAIKLNPDCAFGHAALAWTVWLRMMLFKRDRAELAEGTAAARRAIEIDEGFFLGHVTLGVCQLRNREFENSAISLRRGIGLNPSFPSTYNQLISCLTFGGKPREALDFIEPLDRISPSDPFAGYYRCVRALTYFSLDDDAAAISNAKASLADHPVWLLSELVLIAASQRSGQTSEIPGLIKAFHHNYPKANIANLRNQVIFRDDRDYEVIAAPLREAGIRTP